MHRVPFDEVQLALTSVLQHLHFSRDRTELCARLFAETTRDGIYSHGVNRFSRFATMVQNGGVDPCAESRLVSRLGGLERWDGQRGPGNLNAYTAMERAIALSREHGIGCVALGNTNHWMRGGTYGWQAADAGAIAMCWTNTMPNLPPWGGLEPAIGNNPLVIAIPRTNGPIVLDMAMSQFSYGALESYSRRGELLPVAGGFDRNGELTSDPAAILETQRLLPIGYWKGSGLAVVLDAAAAMLALGRATHAISNDPVRETGLSQVFIALQPAALGEAAEADRIADEVVASLHRCTPQSSGSRVRYSGENMLSLREENMLLGLPVEAEVWEEIRSMV
jgi:3-dehydro-L-gulonate 2-dehydrogenase